jgi:hypothetical protein
MSELPRNERLRLESKAKSGWRCYFVEREKVYRLQEQRRENRGSVLILRSQAPRQIVFRNEAPREDVEYENLKRMFLELYDKVGELCDCPVCYEQMTKDNTCVPLCSHLICKACRERLDACPVCRKKY